MPTGQLDDAPTMRQVNRLPVDPGPAGWNRLLPHAQPFPSLSQQTSADWLVIGAGFSGLAAARRLSQLDASTSIIVVDAQRIAEGPAGRNSGFMIDLPHDLTSDDYGGDAAKDRDQVQLNRDAIAFASEGAKEYALSKEAFNCSGKINAAASCKGHAHNVGYAQHLDKLGEPYDLLDARQMQEVTGSHWYQSGLFTPGTAMIQPALFVRGIARGLSARMSVYENTPITSLARDGVNWRATTPNGSISAGGVILAVNGHIQSFGYFPRQLVHVHTYASMTQALTSAQIKRLGGERVWGATPADPMGTTVRRISGTGGDRLLVRNRFSVDPSLQGPERRMLSVAKTHDRSFIARFPMLHDVDMQYRWGGRLCLSQNNVSAFGELDDNLYCACCQNGLGVARGTLAGKLSAELAMGHASANLRLMQSAEPPKKLPPEFITRMGATAKIKWSEWRAQREL